MGNIKLLDCTLRDGAYIVDSKFGTPAIKGIINKLQEAKIDIIECGWLKDFPHESGSSFFHVPSDMAPYLLNKKKNTVFVAMIDWNRYDLSALPQNDGNTIDAIRVVFPKEHLKEGIALGEPIKEKGYRVFFQAANTLAYSDEELAILADEINKAKPFALSVVDTFGAMYEEDLERITEKLDTLLDPEIVLGFHSHNNQQLSFALSTKFMKMVKNRDVIIDCSLCGMGRGAGNATTELIVNFMNRKHHGNYDMNAIMDAIDTYMGFFTENYSWGYSTPYFISGMYCAHVNNIAYLLKNHRTNARDMRNIIESLSEDERKKYDYDLLENKYIDYQSKFVNDESALKSLQNELENKQILLILPGKTSVKQQARVEEYIEKNHPIVIGVNAVLPQYHYDYLFFSTSIRYDYAKTARKDVFDKTVKIVTSNIKTAADEKEYLINFELLVKRGWEHFDNSGMMCLRLMNKLNIKNVAIAGFDGFEKGKSDDYADKTLPHINPGKRWEELNDEIRDMLEDFNKMTENTMNLEFITDTVLFEKKN